MSIIPPPPSEINNTVAFVIDGTVQEVIFVGDRFNAVLTSNPTIVAVPSGMDVRVGFTFTTDGGFVSNIPASGTQN
jgi:hypothetical protein